MNENEEFFNNGSYEKGIELNKKYYKIAHEDNYEEGKAFCLINMALINARSGNYKDVPLLLNRADFILKDSDHWVLKSLLYHCYSAHYLVLGLIEKANADNDKSIFYLGKCSESDKRNFKLGRVYMTKANLLSLQKNNYIEALKYIRKAISISPDFNPTHECRIGELNLQYNQIDSASFYIEKVLHQIRHAKKVDINQTYVYLVGGIYYSKIKKYQEAEQLYKKSLEIFKILGVEYSPVLMVIYRDLSHLYKETGNTKDENLYLNKYVQVQGKLERDTRNGVDESTRDFIKNIKNENSKDNSNWWIYMISAVSLFVLGGYFYKKNKVLQLKKETLEYEARHIKKQFEKQQLSEIMDLVKNNDPQFLFRFKELYPDFENRLLKINPNLERSELAFCAMIKMNFSSKEISNFTFVQHRSVQHRKHRIRKKFNIPSDVNLYTFFNELDND